MNYYPFGLKHKGYNNVTSANGNSVAQKFGFGGKELNDELGLDWMDFHARNYDASLGRWMNIDRLANTNHSISMTPYHYAANNPIVFVDPDGQDWFYYRAEGDKEASYHWHEGSEYSHTYSYTDEDGNEQTKTITLAGVSSFVGKDQNDVLYYFNDDGSVTESEATEQMLNAGGLDTSFIVNVVSSVSENGNEVQLAMANPLALAIVTGISADTAIPDPSDVAWPKWVGYAIVGGATIALFQTTATMHFAQDASKNEKHGSGEGLTESEQQAISDLEAQLQGAAKKLKNKIKKKIRNIRENAQRRSKGEEHSRKKKGN